MADRQYKPLGTENAPADWTLPGNLQLHLKRAFAHFDGSAAVGSYLPTLQILDDAGRTVLEVPMDAAVAAGSSVEASWAPFLTGRRTASGTTGSLMAARINTTPGSTQSIPNLGEAAVIWGEAAYDLGSPAPFWSAGDPTKLTAPVAGYYIVFATLSWNTGGGFVRGCYMFKNAAPSPPELTYLYEHDDAPPGGGNYFQQGHHMQSWQLNAGDYLQIFGYHDAGAALNLQDLRPAENHYSSVTIVCLATA